MTPSWITATAALALLLAAGGASAQHLGWCNGVGNKHNAGCAPAGGVQTGGSTVTPPTATPTQPTTGGPDLPVTPPTIVVPPQVPQATPMLVPPPVPPQVPVAVPPHVPSQVSATGSMTTPSQSLLLQPPSVTAPVVIRRPVSTGPTAVRGVDPQSQGVAVRRRFPG